MIQLLSHTLDFINGVFFERNRIKNTLKSKLKYFLAQKPNSVRDFRFSSFICIIFSPSKIFQRDICTRLVFFVVVTYTYHAKKEKTFHQFEILWHSNSIRENSCEIYQRRLITKSLKALWEMHLQCSILVFVLFSIKFIYDIHIYCSTGWHN